ncbi:hypothetical protein Tco_0501968 [Tanacetum coccineum]
MDDLFYGFFGRHYESVLRRDMDFKFCLDILKRHGNKWMLWFRLWEINERGHVLSILDGCYIEYSVLYSCLKFVWKGNVIIMFLWAEIGRWVFLFVWSGYAAMRTLMWAVKVVSSVYVDYVGVGTQSIERDRLIGIGVVLDNSFRSLLSDGEIIIEI